VKRWQAVLFALGASIVSAAITDAKQEHDATYPQTRIWKMADDIGHGADLSVVDTAGVCLYVTRQDSYAGAGGTHIALAIAAVPKTQLPKGAGCQ